jgi:hypothetical protein
VNRLLNDDAINEPAALEEHAAVAVPDRHTTVTTSS